MQKLTLKIRTRIILGQKHSTCFAERASVSISARGSTIVWQLELRRTALYISTWLGNKFSQPECYIFERSKNRSSSTNFVKIRFKAILTSSSRRSIKPGSSYPVRQDMPMKRSRTVFSHIFSKSASIRSANASMKKFRPWNLIFSRANRNLNFVRFISFALRAKETMTLQDEWHKEGEKLDLVAMHALLLKSAEAIKAQGNAMVALRSEVLNLRKLPSLSKANSSTKRQRPTPPDKKESNQWKLVEPKDKNEIKSFAGRNWRWCDKCVPHRWVTHMIHNDNFVPRSKRPRTEVKIEAKSKEKEMNKAAGGELCRAKATYMSLIDSIKEFEATG